LTSHHDIVEKLLSNGIKQQSLSPCNILSTKTGRHDLAEILLKVALNTINQIKS
jgi:hypothetical protein